MKCPKCKKQTLRIKVELFLDIHPRFIHRLNKGALRSSDIKIDGANWPTMLGYCTNLKCGFVGKPYYVGK